MERAQNISKIKRRSPVFGVRSFIIMKKVLFFVAAIFLLSACGFEQNKQREWISGNLPEYLWRDITYDAVNTEYHRVYDMLVEKANNAISAYSRKGRQDDLENMRFAYAWGLGDLYELGGGNSSDVKKRNAAIEKYKTNFERVTALLPSMIGGNLHLRDSSYRVTSMPSDDEIFKTLLGTPGKIATDNDDDISFYCRLITVHALEPLERPVIANCEYNKERDLWNVRVDNANNQYVKFYKRDDGDYDVEYSDELKADGTPNSENSITVSL